LSGSVRAAVARSGWLTPPVDQDVRRDAWWPERMTVGLDDAFDEFQKTVDADPQQVKLARERRDLFKTAFGPEGDVAEVFGSGSVSDRMSNLREGVSTGRKNVR
jgi:hypothetical protein